MTVLVVEDNEALAGSIAKWLRQRGHQAKSVSNLAAARQALRNQEISAVCLDIDLPDGSGLDLLENDLRPLRSAMPTVVVTGSGSEADRLRAVRSGARAFLIKPFELSELRSILDGAATSETKARNSVEGDLS